MREALTRWARAVPKPLVQLIDEIDALVGDSLLSVLRQLRAGYDLRPGGFPRSVVPWPVNALAYQTCFRGALAADRSRPVAEADVLEAREALVLRRDTHLDQLTDKLQEERVRRVVEPLLTGARERRFALRDVEYVRDLGLIAQDRPVRMANPIYAEVVPRELSLLPQEEMADETKWYVDDSGALRIDELLAAFQQFFREHSEHWAGRFQYQEAGPQLLLQAFLQRIVNSGGRLRPAEGPQLGREGVPREPDGGKRRGGRSLGDVSWTGGAVGS